MSNGESSGSEPALRTRAEHDALGAATAYARAHELAAPPEAAYLDALPDARRDICRRLVRGLLRGSPAGLPAHRPVSVREPAVPDDPPPLSAFDGEDLLARLRPLPDGTRRVALLPFPASAAAVAAPVVAIHGYDRFRLAGPVSVCTSGDVDRDVHPVDLASLVEREGAFVDAEQADRIRAELAESVANLALARLSPVRSARVEPGDSPLDALAEAIPAADPAAGLERLVTEGHPFHPCAKIRRGMSAADGLAYAPEFAARIDLRFVAVARDYALRTRARDADPMAARLCSTFDGLAGALDRALPPGRDPGEYAVVPVHPWQYHHTIPERYARQLRDGRVVPLPEYTHPATPLLNLRTVVPYGTDRTAVASPPHLKLAVAVQTTNVVRTLSPQAVSNGPQVTDVLAEVASRESFETLGFLAESAAACYHAPGGPHPEGEAYDDARHLSGMVRENPHAHPFVGDDAHAVPGACLVATPPRAERPLVCELLDRYADRTGATGTADAVREFVDAYARAVVPEQVFLAGKYGIALESHLQNCCVVFEAAAPVAALVRDFGGIRVYDERLADHGLSMDPYPDSDLDADAEAELYRKLYYALFQNHLAELVAAVVHETGVDEGACWDRIRRACERGFAALRSDPSVPDERVARDERALFADPAVHKALTAMRLGGRRHEYVTSRVSNPLAEARPGCPSR